MAEEKKDKAAEEKKEAKDASKEGAEVATSAEGEEGAKSKSKKKLIIIIAAALVLLIAIGAGVFFVLKSKKSAPEEQSQEAVVEEHGEKKEGEEGHGEKKAEKKDSEPGAPIYVDMQDFLVNLNSTGKQTTFLKMQVTLDVPDEKTKSVVESNMPRIRDAFQVYLHELRPDDVRGSAGLQMLREELLLRINRIIYPNKVSDILFKEILVQ